jgi:spermidine synthase
MAREGDPMSSLRHWVVMASVVSACVSRPDSATLDLAESPAPVSSSVDDVPEVPLSPGTLAQAKGVAGLVRVEERDGMRLLTVDGVVQGGMRLDEPPGTTPHGDPLVGLVLGARPQTKTALLVGLGTGRTAMELASRGVKVDVVELEPAVVDFARTFFGFRGDVEVGDGAQFLDAATSSWDAVLIDASSRADASSPMLQTDVLERARRRGRIVALRFVGTPEHAREAARTFGDHQAVYGSGVGEESQNVYILGGSTLLDVVADDGLAVFPLRGAGHDTSKLPTERRAEIRGYLVRLREDQSLALDLPHAEMGALRFVLSGDAVEQLEDHLERAKAVTFPTAGEITSDGPLDATLHGALGGGGAMRSDVRYSALAAAVRGTVRLRAVVDPDHVFAGRLMTRGPPRPDAPAAREPLLPYGGVLYELEVEEVLWVLDAPTWKARVAKFAPRLRKASAAARIGRLGDAARHLADVADALAETTGATPTVIEEMRSLASTLAREAGSLDGSAFSRASACDRAAHHTELGEVATHRSLYEPVVTALVGCARREYEKVVAIGGGDRDVLRAAARLQWLYEMSDDDRDVMKSHKLSKRFPNLRQAASAPGHARD